ncbi:ABC transporter permease [Rathayibacter toxicus]|uniref:ABC transporter permease n=1 Tax=Rathayibacter toxicus TaxID=145458 RepID=UPI000CE9326B|nr:ABC transporter permease [Rathayibacter toxicus]PPI56753.1 hypothetical protein C5D35_00415 [Rathayibacter toxicus]QOD10486.1 ABC transporter permease [Rathayibacter toxicus]QWL27221.1 ABC transporter permease [Rathayibacter toxicus]
MTVKARGSLSGGLALGLVQARIELAQKFTSWTMLGYLVLPGSLWGGSLIFEQFFAERQDAFRFILVSMTAAWLAMTGIMTLSSAVIADQDEGVILRAKTLPYGLVGYFVGKVILLSTTSLVGLVLLLLAGEASFGGVLPRTADRWGLFLVLAALAVAATAPIGAIAGSLARGPLASLPISLVSVALISCSGLFIPIDNGPDWLGPLAHVLPVYWLGELSRQVFGSAPPALSPVDGVAMFVVPLLWAAVTVLLVPRAVAVLSRRQSGARLQALIERRAARGY